MKLLVVSCLAAALVACQDDPASRSQAEQCAAALTSFNRVIDKGGEGSGVPPAAAVKAAVLARCTEDRWSERVTTCMRDAKASQDTFACWNELPPQQRDAVRGALGELSP